jgi:hypothetical protein
LAEAASQWPSAGKFQKMEAAKADDATRSSDAQAEAAHMARRTDFLMRKPFMTLVPSCFPISNLI